MQSYYPRDSLTQKEFRAALDIAKVYISNFDTSNLEDVYITTMYKPSIGKSIRQAEVSIPSKEERCHYNIIVNLPYNMDATISRMEKVVYY